MCGKCAVESGTEDEAGNDLPKPTMPDRRAGLSFPEGFGPAAPQGIPSLLFVSIQNLAERINEVTPAIYDPLDRSRDDRRIARSAHLMEVILVHVIAPIC